MDQRKPMEGYIKRNVELHMVQLRIDTELHEQAERAKRLLNTSMARLLEAALRAYLDDLKREGSI